MSRAETHQAAQTVVDAQLPEKPQSLRKPRSGQIRLCWSTPRTAPSHAGPELILARNSLDQLEARLREVYASRRDKTPFVLGAPSLHYGAIVGAGAGRRQGRAGASTASASSPTACARPLLPHRSHSGDEEGTAETVDGRPRPTKKAGAISRAGPHRLTYQFSNLPITKTCI